MINYICNQILVLNHKCIWFAYVKLFTYICNEIQKQYFTLIFGIMDEKERIEKIMQKEEMSAAIFANEIGIQGSTLSHILNGRNNPSLDVLKKILNRFRTISSDWLILGIGSMYRAEKQSQTPTLFDNLDESSSKSVISNTNEVEKSESLFSSNQQKKGNSGEVVPQALQNSLKNIISVPEVTSKLVRKIIVYYTDNTFQEFETK